jgi:hypothetical protein
MSLCAPQSIPEERAKGLRDDVKDGAVIVGVVPKNDEDVHYFENDWCGSALIGRSAVVRDGTKSPRRVTALGLFFLSE